MKKLNVNEMRSVEGGRSYSPVLRALAVVPFVAVLALSGAKIDGKQIKFSAKSLFTIDGEAFYDVLDFSGWISAFTTAFKEWLGVDDWFKTKQR